MTIIIPMAGLSSRFTKAGYTLPKYMLYIKDKSLFNLAISSFKNYFQSCTFVFIARNAFDTETFIKEECKILGIKSFKIIMLAHSTSGQAETVLKGIMEAKISENESLLIFNIDTFRPEFKFPSNIDNWDGYLETFKGSGANWSYARTESLKSTKVVETAEKREISDNCSTGIYYFKEVHDFIYAYNQHRKSTEGKSDMELYVAPLYNQLICIGKEIHIVTIDRDKVIFCGVPQEYIDYLTAAI